MSSKYSQPGAGDPYWFEWYVGLDYVISMLAGVDDIESVTFQEAGLEGVDDVVVRRSQGLPMVCVQVKHKKASTTTANNLTFAALVTEGVSSEGEGPKKSLLASLAAGWKQISLKEEAAPEIVLYTNREMGVKKSDAVYMGKPYKRLPLGEFWDKVSAKLGSATSFSELIFDDSDLDAQWHEFADSTNLRESDVVPFLSSLTIKAGAPSLRDKEIELTGRLKDEVCAGSEELASRVFTLLAAELRRWTTAAGDNAVTAEIVRECICGLNRNPMEAPIGVPVPTPVFPSREHACSLLCDKLESSDSKVVFLQGRPGSGKTRLVSCLCERMTPRPFRFYAFKPLDVDDFSYSPDAGIVSPRELWSTLLNQLRDASELSGEKPRIPIINELCNDDELRSEVLRLAGLLSTRRGSRTILAIDGIDHAARAKEKLTFLRHLPSPTSIPDGVLILVSGQPANLYSSYPQWLRGEHAGVEVVSLPNIDADDVSALLVERTGFSGHDSLVLSNEIINITNGNTLSVMYAVNAVADEMDCGRAVDKLRSLGLSENVEEYYESIWQKADDEIQRHHGNGSNALGLIASSMHLLDGAIYPGLLCNAFPDVFSEEYVVARDISILSPLLRKCADGSTCPIHNDFRLFVSSKALEPGMEGYLRFASNNLADAALGMEGDVVRSCYSIRLLAASRRVEECINLFDASYVIDAVAHGVPWRILCEQAKTVYGMACESGELENVLRVQLALSTLSQVNEHFEYWLERRPFLHFEELVGMDYMVPPLSKETAALYATTLDRCLWLLKDVGCAEQSDELYSIWFSGLSPLAALSLLSDSNEEDGAFRQDDGISMLMSAWGGLAAARGLDFDDFLFAADLGGDAEDLRSRFRDAFVRGLLMRPSLEDEDLSRIAELPITGDAAADTMRDLLTGALPASRAARCAFFTKLSAYSFRREIGTMAYALCLSEGLLVSGTDRSKPLLCHREGSVYREGFTVGLFAESFVFGYESDCDGFDTMTLDMDVSIAWMDRSNREYLSLVRTLRASACLGYAVGHDEAILPGTDEARVLGEWAQAPSWPGLLTMETCAVPYVAFVAMKGVDLCADAFDEEELEGFIFSKNPLCTKLRMLEHLQMIGSEVPRRYLSKKYGPDGSALLASQDAVEIHDMLRPLLVSCDRSLAIHCDEAILFGSARFTGHKDYSLSNLIEAFGTLSDLGMATETQAFGLLELDNAASQSGDNRMSSALMEKVADWAASEGPAQLSRIRSLQPEYRYDHRLIEYQLRSLLASAGCLNDVLAVFAGLLGNSPCCSAEDVEGLRFCLKICRNKAVDLGCGDGFEREVSDIEMTIKDAPKYESLKSGVVNSTTSVLRNLSDLSDEEVRHAAFRQEVDRWHWEPVVEACSELVDRGFEKGEVFNNLVEARGAALCEEGWVHSSSSVTKLVDGIAGYSDDEFFFKLLSWRNEGLDRYGFGSASNDIAHVVMVRARVRKPALFEVMFELECDSKRRWITCNGKCELPALEKAGPGLPEPGSLPELVTDILLDSILPEDPHRTEDAVRGITWGGMCLEGVRGRACEGLPALHSYERILLEKVLGRWWHAFPGDDAIRACFVRLLDKMKRVDEACVLSICAAAPGIILKPDIADPLPTEGGSCEVPSRVKTFLSEAYVFCGDGCEDVRDAIESCCGGEVRPFVKRYMQNDVVALSTCRQGDFGQELLYSEMCRGRWLAIPGYIAASVLVDPADVWCFARLPVFKDPSAYGVSRAIELFEAGSNSEAGDVVDRLPMMGLNEGEACLGWKLYVPYGSRVQQYEYYGTARMASLECDDPDNVIDREHGCYGLLSASGGGMASSFSQNSISLCNVLAGSITMTFCDCQIFPSRAMRMLGFNPIIDDPLVWVDVLGNRVAWFEQFCFPAEKGFSRSAYYRQPRLWRWVFNEELVEKAAEERGHRIYWSTESSNHIDQIKDRYDMREAIKMMSPFEK